MPTIAPPEVPQGFDSKVTDYLRRFSLWAYQELLNKITNNEATPSVIFSASDQKPPKAAYQLAVNSSGVIMTRPVALASGDVGPPVFTTGGIPDAPNDGKVYGRQNLGWQQLSQQAGMLPTTPLSTSSTTYLMCGFGLLLSSDVATRMILSVSGNIVNNTNNGETDAQLCYGTGSAPGAGSPITGTQIGTMIRYEASTGGSMTPFSKTVLISGLIVNTLYWVDLAVKVVSGTGGVTELDLAAIELL